MRNMKNVKQLIKFKAIFLMAVSMLFFTCSDKLEENDGQLSADDLDYTNMDDMILPLLGAYSRTYKINDQTDGGWENPLLMGVRGDDVNSGGEGDQPLFAATDMFQYDNGFWM